MELKILKALLESCFQAILQVAIIMRSNKMENSNFGYFELMFIIVSLTSVSIACSKNINIEIHFMNRSHLESNLPVTCMNTLLYFFIIMPRIWSWALIWSYYSALITGGKTQTYKMYQCAITLRNTMIFAVIIIIHQVTNFCISYYTAKHNKGVTDKEWTAGDFAVSIMDGMTSKICPIFPRTMLKMAIGSTIVLVVVLGKMILLFIQGHHITNSDIY